jgi:hypothetical protein
VNRCSWAHCVDLGGRRIIKKREQLLNTHELQALDGTSSPHGVIIPNITA